MCLSFAASRSVCQCAPGAVDPKERTGSSGTGAPDGYGLPCGSWELSLSPLEAQQVTLNTKSLIQPVENLLNT